MFQEPKLNKKVFLTIKCLDIVTAKVLVFRDVLKQENNL